MSRREPVTSIGLRSERGPILLAMMLSMSLIALDATIIATAIPSIVRQLGGFAQFPWLFSVYLLAQAVTVPVYGKVADMIGRRPVILLGIGLFLLGSLVGGFAWSMTALIVGRGIQGVGAGAIQPTVVTVIGDLYSIEERARVQGYMGSVWGAASVIGPTLGGVFSQYLSWRWIFFVNLPLGAVAAWVLRTRFHEDVRRSSHRVDYLGASLIALASSLLVLGLLEGGVSWPWLSPAGFLVPAAGFVLLGWFVLVERRAAEPVLPPWVFGKRVFATTALAAAGAGSILIGLTSYLTTFAQGVLGATPVVAGLALAAMMVGWPLASSQAGRIYLRIGFRDTSLVGGAVVVVGSFALLLLNVDSHIWYVGVLTFFLGVGMGLSVIPLLVAVQSAVGWRERGVVTGANMFARSMGSAIGVAIYGAVANATLAHRLDHPPEALRGKLPTSVDQVSQAVGGKAVGAVRDYLRELLYAAMHNVFIGIAISAVVMFAFIVAVPRRTEQVADQVTASD